MPAPGSSSGAYKLGEAFVELKAKDTGFAKKIIAAGAGVSGLTTLLTVAGTAAINFEKQMARVSTMLVDGATKYLPGYSKAIQTLSVRFADSTASLTSGLYDILSATVPPAKAMEHLETAARAATAGMTSTAVAAKTISGFMQAYNINVNESADVSDWMFEVVRRGLITFPELAAQLGQAAASASMVGVSMEELGASISTVTRAGVPAGRAMTAINALMQSFLKPTDLARAVAKKYGFEMNVATIRQKGFLGVLKALRGAQAQEAAAIGSRIRGIRALSALLQNIYGYQEDLNFQSRRTGRTQEAFAKMASTTAFKLGQLRESVKRVAVAFGSLLLPRIKLVTDWLGRLLKRVYELDPAVKKLTVDFALWVPALTLAWLAIRKMNKAFVALIGVSGVAIWAKFRKEGEKGIAGVFNAFKRFASWFRERYGDSFRIIIYNLKKAWSGLTEAITKSLTEVSDTWGLINKAFGKSDDLFTKVTDAIVKGLMKASHWISFAANNMGLVWDLVANEASIAFDRIEHRLRDFANKLMQTFLMMGKQIAESLDVKKMLLDIPKWIHNTLVKMTDLTTRPALQAALERATEAGDPAEMKKALDALRAVDAVYEKLHIGGTGVPSPSRQMAAIWGAPSGEADISAKIQKRKDIWDALLARREQMGRIARIEVATQKLLAANEEKRLANAKKWQDYMKGVGKYLWTWKWLADLIPQRPRIQLGGGEIDRGLGGPRGLGGGQRPDIWFGGPARMGGGRPQDKVAMNVKAHKDEAHADIWTLIDISKKFLAELKKPTVPATVDAGVGGVFR
jgi:TP901 family phage tail tape measure protein